MVGIPSRLRDGFGGTAQPEPDANGQLMPVRFLQQRAQVVRIPGPNGIAPRCGQFRQIRTAADAFDEIGFAIPEQAVLSIASL